VALFASVGEGGLTAVAGGGAAGAAGKEEGHEIGLAAAGGEDEGCGLFAAGDVKIGAASEQELDPVGTAALNGIVKQGHGGVGVIGIGATVEQEEGHGQDAVIENPFEGVGIGAGGGRGSRRRKSWRVSPWRYSMTR